jgi:hypothetical protein
MVQTYRQKPETAAYYDKAGYCKTRLLHGSDDCELYAADRGEIESFFKSSDFGGQ